MSSSDEEVEETFLVYSDFNEMLDSEIFKNNQVKYKLIGAETEKPILQIQDQVYVGEYKDAVGTCVFFKELKHNSSTYEDPVFSKIHKKNLHYACKTNKILHFSRTFLKTNEEGDGENSANAEKQKVNDTSKE